MFWNVKGQVPIELLSRAAREEDIDLLILAENSFGLAELAVALNTAHERLYLTTSKGLPQKFRRGLTIFFRLPSESVRTVSEDGEGFFAIEVRPPLGISLNVIGLHLRSKFHTADVDQTLAAVEVRKAIERAESQTGHTRTVVIGDLNMQPFEPGVVAASGFHAVMSREIAREGGRRVDGIQRSFFYNPMWNLFGDRPPSPPGSFFRAASGQLAYYWYLLDQVLVRPALLPWFVDDDVRVLTSIGETSLITSRGRPNAARYSDHLPLVVDIHVEKGFEANGQNKPVDANQGLGEGNSAPDSGAS